MKKIGIVTFQNAYNYGAALQAFALKNVIGEGCEIVNYTNEYFIPKEDKSIKRRIVKIIYKRRIKKKVSRFKKFQREFLVGEQLPLRDDTLRNINSKYDLFITGSDQVWNLETSGNNYTYFLNFVEDSSKKNSYAASFGTDSLSEKNLVAARKSIIDYKNISIRETSGQKIIKELIGRDVPVVLDPTLLMTSNEWNKFISAPIVNKKYILLYTVLNGDSIVEHASNLAKSMDADLFCITSSLKPQFGVKCIRDAGPLEWLNLMSNAEAIVTNSFHGLAFSLIFNKQFYVELLPPPHKTNARMRELLESLELTDRIVSNRSDINLMSLINYMNVNNILDMRRKESMNYLHQIISD